MSSTESTKNVKGNRKIVRAEYFPQSTIFKIPDGLDLDDKDIVERWLVKNDTLYIKYVGKEEEERIEPEYRECIYDPDECLIEDADDHGIEYEEDEEEEVCLWACKCQNCIGDEKEEVEEADKYKLWKSQSIEITCRKCGNIGHKHDWNDDDDDMEYGTCGACEEEEDMSSTTKSCEYCGRIGELTENKDGDIICRRCDDPDYQCRGCKVEASKHCDECGGYGSGDEEEEEEE